MGGIVNSSVPHVPLVRQGKSVAQFANWISGGETKPMPPYPQGFLQGLLGGGVLQDIAGQIPADELPESLKDWGEGGTKKSNSKRY